MTILKECLTLVFCLNRSQLNNLGCSSLEGTIPHLEFTIELQSNNLTYHQSYSKKQEITYKLIKHLYEVEGLGYRRICKKLNSWGIKTQRGKQWFPQSVFSVLKRKRQRDDRIENLRLKVFDSKVSEFQIKYYTFD